METSKIHDLLAFSAILILESVFFIEKYLWFIPEELNLKIGKSLSRVAHFILPGDAKYLLGLCDLAFLSNPGVPPSDYVILAHG